MRCMECSGADVKDKTEVTELDDKVEDYVEDYKVPVVKALAPTLDDEEITEVIIRINSLPRYVAAELLLTSEVIGDERLISEGFIHNIKRMDADVASALLYKMRFTENVDALIDSRIFSPNAVHFFNEIGKEAASMWFSSIGTTGRVGELTGRSATSAEMIATIGGDGKLASELSFAIGKTGRIDALTNHNFLRFVGALDKESAASYVSAIWVSEKVDKLADPEMIGRVASGKVDLWKDAARVNAGNGQMTVVLTKTGDPEHDRGVKLTAHDMMKKGFDVIYLDNVKSHEEVVRAALSTGAHAIGWSVADDSSSRQIIFDTIRQMGALGHGNVVMFSGGAISQDTMASLEKSGVKHFTPDTIKNVANFLNTSTVQQLHLPAQGHVSAPSVMVGHGFDAYALPQSYATTSHNIASPSISISSTSPHLVEIAAPQLAGSPIGASEYVRKLYGDEELPKLITHVSEDGREVILVSVVSGRLGPTTLHATGRYLRAATTAALPNQSAVSTSTQSVHKTRTVIAEAQTPTIAQTSTIHLTSLPPSSSSAAHKNQFMNGLLSGIASFASQAQSHHAKPDQIDSTPKHVGVFGKAAGKIKEIGEARKERKIEGLLSETIKFDGKFKEQAKTLGIDLSSVGLPDYYQLLGARQGDSGQAIRQAYLKQVKKYHPDVSTEIDAASKMKEINEAYAVLRNKRQRVEYDSLFAGGRNTIGAATTKNIANELISRYIEVRDKEFDAFNMRASVPIEVNTLRAMIEEVGDWSGRLDRVANRTFAELKVHGKKLKHLQAVNRHMIEVEVREEPRAKLQQNKRRLEVIVQAYEEIVRSLPAVVRSVKKEIAPTERKVVDKLRYSI